MKKFTTDHISKIIQDSRQANSLLLIAEIQKEIIHLWESVNDPILNRVKVEIYLENGGLVFCCFSSVVLNYLRRKRLFLSHHFNGFMENNGIHKIEIILGEERK